MIRLKIFFVASCTLLLASCQSAPKNSSSHSPQAPKETTKDVVSAIESVTGALTQKQLTAQETKRLVHDIQKDENAQSAIRSMAGAMDVKKSGVMYCPLTGKRYSAELEICPEHGELLKELVD